MLIQTASKIFFDKNQYNMLKLIFESVSYIQDSGMKWVKLEHLGNSSFSVVLVS